MVQSRAYTIGSPKFDPSRLFEDEKLTETFQSQLSNNDFLAAICTAFAIPKADKYVYHATASVTLAQVQQAVAAGSAHGLHDWYVDAESKLRTRPELADVSGYISIFDPSKSSANTLKGLKANAKKQSLRAGVIEYLISKRHVDSSIVIPKRKQPHPNPYIDFWAWSCFSLEYAGPDQFTSNVRLSHHVLPVFMHHFSCACPSFESLQILKQVAGNRTVLDVGSGNGYWTLMLRRHGCEVVAVDNGQSRWRTCWIDDTVLTDGVQFIKTRGEGGGAKEDVLLMVYPVVAGEFTRKVVEEYKGDTVAVVGTQNSNGYTGFKDQIIDQWMAKEHEDFEKIVQVPLPSFAGKDDALFVFRKKS